MRVLVAFDKFKDALSASEACAIAGAALQELHPTWTIDACPLSDGGEGFAEILTRAAGGTIQSHAVTGPRGGPVEAPLGLVRVAALPAAVRARLAAAVVLPPAASLAVLDLASASGLAVLAEAERDPWRTSTQGTGELIGAAAATGAAAILIGIGGSATNDLGLGALAALGLEFVSPTGELIAPPTPAGWEKIARLRGHLAPGLPSLLIACDVDNPLLGPRGAAAVYGPQKGLRAADRARMEHASARLATLLCAHTGRPAALVDEPGAGAAGGFAFGLRAGAGARLLPGFALVADWLDLDRRLAAADLVLTGEGSFDATSLAGKGPGAVVARAEKAGRPVHVFAGRVGSVDAFAVTLASVDRAVRLHAISPPDWPLPVALAATRASLRTAVQQALR